MVEPLLDDGAGRDIDDLEDIAEAGIVVPQIFILLDNHFHFPTFLLKQENDVLPTQTVVESFLKTVVCRRVGGAQRIYTFRTFSPVVETAQRLQIVLQASIVLSNGLLGLVVQCVHMIILLVAQRDYNYYDYQFRKFRLVGSQPAPPQQSSLPLGLQATGH
jgi:hypothetical protein